MADDSARPLTSTEGGFACLPTGRLLLRPFASADLAAFAALNADRRVSRHLGEPLTREQSDTLAERVREHWRERGFGVWAVERSDVPERPFIGAVGLMVPAFEAHFTPCVEVAWRLVPEHWGQGLATEAAAAALRIGFGPLRLEEIVAFTTHANRASRRVMEKLGMSRDPADDFEHPALPPGHPLRPHVLYRLKGGAAT